MLFHSNNYTFYSPFQPNSENCILSTDNHLTNPSAYIEEAPEVMSVYFDVSTCESDVMVTSSNVTRIVRADTIELKFNDDAEPDLNGGSVDRLNEFHTVIRKNDQLFRNNSTIIAHPKYRIVPKPATVATVPPIRPKVT